VTRCFHPRLATFSLPTLLLCLLEVSLASRAGWARRTGASAVRIGRAALLNCCTSIRGKAVLDPLIALAVFPVIFIGELPDKTMFASLVMATRGRPRQVWLGAAGAFVVHVAIAVTIGVAVFALLPHRVVELVVAVMFLLAAVYAWREGDKDEDEFAETEASRHGAILSSFIVIFVAEWGDLTQILTANLAARYHSPVSVAIGSVLALWAVAAIAVMSGRTLLRVIDITTVRRVTAVVLVALAGYSFWSAFR